ncbi:MAG TPA: RNA 2',3'-cyclic phosphodiesterase [Candidatus Moranbacteria bacterium]|nr:RNA 2',3'-cyclic phosphodiesterase [Candidatus Moranbacteria bacterium]HAT74567.1 RNA 2',3'-cyclic phosphodiesterase [Candidatus Moranbacteria bacterium]
MKRKIYININIAARVKRRLAKTVEKWQSLPVKWTKEENLHIALIFLGYIDNDVVFDVCRKIRKATENMEIFDLEFEKIYLAPDNNNSQEFRVTGKASEKLKNLRETIEKELDIFTAPKKAFSPHITLGKIRKEKWKELKIKPEISEKSSFSVGVESVDIMASHFEGGKNDFVLIKSCPLK